MPLDIPPREAEARLPRAIRAAHARRGGSAGFTFVELIVGLAIMVMITSVVAPALLGSLDRKRIDTSVDTFTSLYTAVFAFEGDVGDYPGQLSQLTGGITTSLRNVCSQTFSSGEVSDWDGPYLARSIPTTGVKLPIGRARNTVTSLPAGSLDPSELLVAVDSVILDDALAIDAEVGDDGAQTTGLVRWTNADADGLVTMSLVVQINGC